MEKILLSFASTFGNATTEDAISAFSVILIGLPLLIILYYILKWTIKVDEKMSVLREVVQTYKQLQEEKEEETSSWSDVPNISTSIDDFSETKSNEECSIVASTGRYSAANSCGQSSVAASTGSYSVANSNAQNSIVAQALESIQ